MYQTGRPEGLPTTARPLEKRTRRGKRTACVRRRAGTQSGRQACAAQCFGGVWSIRAARSGVFTCAGKTRGQISFQKIPTHFDESPYRRIRGRPEESRSIDYSHRISLTPRTCSGYPMVNGHNERLHETNGQQKTRRSGFRFGVAWRQTRRNCPRFALTTKFGIFDTCANRRCALPGVGCGDRI